MEQTTITTRTPPRKVPKDADFPAFCAVAGIRRVLTTTSMIQYLLSRPAFFSVNTWCKEPVYRGQPQPEFSQDKASGNVTITVI